MKKKPAPKGDTTQARRQTKRRKGEKDWLTSHGFTSWESLHTKLLSGEYGLIKKKKPSAPGAESLHPLDLPPPSETG